MSTQKNEQYHILSPEWLKTNPLPDDGEFQLPEWGDDWYESARLGKLISDDDRKHYRYRTRRTDLPPEAYAEPAAPCPFYGVTPPTDTTGSGREGETVPMDHVIDRSTPVETQLAQAEAWIAQLQHSYRSIQQTCTNKDAQVEALRRDGERLDWLERHPGIVNYSVPTTVEKRPGCWRILFGPKDETNRFPTLRAAIDSAQRQEGR